MIEVLYDKETKIVRAWCADSKQFGNLKRKQEETIVFLPIELADIPESDDHWVDIENKTLIGNPEYKLPVERDLRKELDDLKHEVEKLKRERPERG